MNNIAIQLITMFGIGRISKIPGTIASFVTCLFYFLCIICNVNIIFLFITFFIILIISIIFINKYSSNFTEIDAKEIVIDEFLGQSIPLMSFYYFIHNSSDVLTFIWIKGFTFGFISWIFLSFLLFRFFDILKPFPINLIDNKIKNGFGVMLDDVVAGIFATLVLFMGISLWY